MFILFTGATKLSFVPGLSAAGANVAALPYTAPADADILFFDRPRIVDSAPVDPFGHPTPAIVTRAAVIEGNLPVRVICAGASVEPAAPHDVVSLRPSEDPRFGPAVADAEEIARASASLGRSLTGEKRVVLAESIPAGTTTALLLLRALGYAGTVSSASPVNPLPLKEQIWAETARRLDIAPGGLKGKGLAAARELGDPMQLAVASFALALPSGTEVVLAGGTQMMAVAALLRDCGYARPLTVATTRYIAEDKTACFKEFAAQAGVDTYAAPFDFSRSKFAGLADYEKGFVKEGVGMGGAAWYAMQRGATMEGIIARTEALYEAVCLKG